MNKEALEAEASVAASRELLVETCQGNITSFTKDVFSSLQEPQAALLSTICLKKLASPSTGEKMMEYDCTGPV